MWMFPMYLWSLPISTSICVHVTDVFLREAIRLILFFSELFVLYGSSFHVFVFDLYDRLKDYF